MYLSNNLTILSCRGSLFLFLSSIAFPGKVVVKKKQLAGSVSEHVGNKNLNKR